MSLVVLGLLKDSLLVDSFTSSAVVHTVAPTIVVVVGVVVGGCCHADNERSDKQTKATSFYVDLVGLKVFSSVELSRTW
jgi:hypothetical protein